MVRSSRLPAQQLQLDHSISYRFQPRNAVKHHKGDFCRSASAAETSIAPLQASSVQIDSVLYQVCIESALCTASSSPAAPQSLRFSNFQDEKYSVEGSLTSTASPETVYSILTDYSSLPRIFHNINDCSIRHQGDEKHLVQVRGNNRQRWSNPACPYTLLHSPWPLQPSNPCLIQHLQTCSWAFLVFHGTFVTELIVDEDEDAGRLAFSLLRSAFMKQFIGSWHVEPHASGTGSSIRHALAVKPVLAPPQKIGDLTKNIFVSQVESILKDLANELERHELQKQQNW